MKKKWHKLYRKDLLFDFIIYGILILLGGGFLLYHIKTVINDPVSLSENIKVTMLFTIAIFAVIFLSAISLYRISASYIRWYKGVLDTIPMPVIVTDAEATWCQINRAARKMMDLAPDSEINTLNSKHLIEAAGCVTKKAASFKGIEYTVICNQLEYGNQGAGYLMILNDTNINTPDGYKTRTELIDEINGLLRCLKTTTDRFHDCANTLAGYNARQAGIIDGLSGVIVDIASGKQAETDALNAKICAVAEDMQQHMENSQASMNTVIKTVKMIDETHDYLGTVLHHIGSDS